MNTGPRAILFSFFFMVLAALSLWTLSSVVADGGSENVENREPLNQDITQQPGTSPHLTIVAETGYLELEQGFVGDKLGAEIERISVDETEQFQIIDIRIPLENPESVNQVRVIGPSGKTIPQIKPAKISRNHEDNNVGVKLFLSRNKNWVFKVKLVENSQ